MKKMELIMNMNGILLVGTVILVLALGFGFMCGVKYGEKTSEYNSTDVQKITKAYDTYGDDAISVRKNWKGELTIRVSE